MAPTDSLRVPEFGGETFEEGREQRDPDGRLHDRRERLEEVGDQGLDRVLEVDLKRWKSSLGRINLMGMN